MDNLAHSLCGAALARAGIVRHGPLVTATLVVAANAPDIDAFIYVFGDSIDALTHRRGWTHALITFVVQAPLLAALFFGVGKRIALRRGTQVPCGRSLLLASSIGYLSHVALDLFNTYGVRFLLPFDERWYRGDMAFIVDPWMWLMFGGATLWGGAVRRAAYVFWFVLIALGCFAMDMRSVPLAINLLWALCMSACAVLRARRDSNKTLPRVLLVLVALYLGGLKLGSNTARQRGLGVVSQTTGDVQMESTVNPFPAVPWRSTVVVATDKTIYRVRVNLLDDSATDAIYHELARNLDDPGLPGLSHTREYRVWRHFARHPFVYRSANQISLGDGRYSGGGPNGWATFTLPIQP